jgi:2-methylisocitrate lyase-like PEP mutase family enzyme
MNNYENFMGLHHQQKPLVVANAWNVKSARLIEAQGFAAIATSSGAIADSLGYADGEKIPFSELLYVIGRIAACTTIPLSVDLERGYTDDLEELNGHIQQLIDLGVAGINLEDTQGEDIYLKKLMSVKSYLTKTNQKLFINARTDVFFAKAGIATGNNPKKGPVICGWRGGWFICNRRTRPIAGPGNHRVGYAARQCGSRAQVGFYPNAGCKRRKAD